MGLRRRPVVPAEAGTHLAPSPLTGEGWGEGDFSPYIPGAVGARLDSLPAIS